MSDPMPAIRSILGAPERTPHIPPSPDCKAGKHAACDGKAWDFANDREAHCLCDCHVVSDVAVYCGPGGRIRQLVDAEAATVDLMQRDELATEMAAVLKDVDRIITGGAA